MRRTITALTVAGAVAVGGLAGSVLAAPLAGAAETAGGAVSWVEEAISGLVDDGTITEDQGDAVQAALEEARPERGEGGPGRGGPGHLDLAAVAATVDLTEEEVQAALAEGQTLAELAAEQGVEVDAVVAALVEVHQARLDEAVAAGELTQEEADEHAARHAERAADLVEGTAPALRGGGPHGGFPGGGPGLRPGTDEEDAPDDDDATAEGTSAAA